MKNKWVFVLGFLAACVGGNALAQDGETKACKVPAGKGIEVFEKCEAGDTVIWQETAALHGAMMTVEMKQLA